MMVTGSFHTGRRGWARIAERETRWESEKRRNGDVFGWELD